MRVLVTGGCGYIGQHVVRACVDAGHQILLIDRKVVEPGKVTEPEIHVQGEVSDLEGGEFYNRIDVVIHLAAEISVSESVIDPAEYYENNLVDGLHLLNLMRRWSTPVSAYHRRPRLIFASSAAVYSLFGDEDVAEPMFEEWLTDPPSSPYGDTKLAFERILAAYKRAYGLDYVALRLFNVAGGRFQERHDPETHLIPLLVDAAIHGTPFTVHGIDFDTPDGTCVRDYVSAEDVARACVLALDAPIKPGSEVMNIGQGTGFSVREVIKVVERITERTIDIQAGPRREGDPPYLVADITRAEKVLGWLPTESLEAIVRDVVRNRF